MKKDIYENLMYGYSDVMKVYHVGRSKAYDLMRKTNFNLIRNGYRTVQGRVPAKYIQEYCKKKGENHE